MYIVYLYGNHLLEMESVWSYIHTSIYIYIYSQTTFNYRFHFFIYNWLTPIAGVKLIEISISFSVWDCETTKIYSLIVPKM